MWKPMEPGSSINPSVRVNHWFCCKLHSVFGNLLAHCTIHLNHSRTNICFQKGGRHLIRRIPFPQMWYSISLIVGLHNYYPGHMTPIWVSNDFCNTTDEEEWGNGPPAVLRKSEIVKCCRWDSWRISQHISDMRDSVMQIKRSARLAVSMWFALECAYQVLRC